jgi:hypothetical protein
MLAMMMMKVVEQYEISAHRERWTAVPVAQARREFANTNMISQVELEGGKRTQFFPP